ncbi:sulfurtransferase [Terribacillus saccharophilus]|nr:sulfurtransferase [Terribacillus saccharophilus]
MNIYFFLITALILVLPIYKRYFPIIGVPCRKNGPEMTNTLVLDIREYKERIYPTRSDVHIPYAYLKRYKEEIPNGLLHLVVQDRLELNLGVRYLASKGYRIASYQVNNCPCKRKGR